ncbi:MAG: dockerin type I domain-containing protein, partial [Planctomycetota bacterium]
AALLGKDPLDLGPGIDELRLAEASDLDLTEFHSGSLAGVERIDVRQNETDTVTLSAVSLLQTTGTGNATVWIADQTDQFTMDGSWQFEEPVSIGGVMHHRLRSGSVEVLLEKGSIDTNPIDRYDVNRDFRASVLDALAVINRLSHLNSQDDLSNNDQSWAGYFDASGDGRVSPLDALVVINHLSRRNEPRSEGEQTPRSLGRWVQPMASGFLRTNDTRQPGKQKDDSDDDVLSSQRIDLAITDTTL